MALGTLGFLWGVKRELRQRWTEMQSLTIDTRQQFLPIFLTVAMSGVVTGRAGSLLQAEWLSLHQVAVLEAM